MIVVYQLHYSIFKYKDIVLAILFHEPFVDYREFKHIEDVSCVLKLDSGFDEEILKKLLRGINEQIKQPAPFEIEEFTRFYLNDFHFEEMQIACCDSIENMVIYLTDFHLYIA